MKIALSKVFSVQIIIVESKFCKQLSDIIISLILF